MWWILAREVLRLRGTISREVPWDVMPDLYFYRHPKEAEKEEQEKQAKEVVPVPPQGRSKFIFMISFKFFRASAYGKAWPWTP
jgi:hypothetical protein